MRAGEAQVRAVRTQSVQAGDWSGGQGLDGWNAKGAISSSDMGALICFFALI